MPRDETEYCHQADENSRIQTSFQIGGCKDRAAYIHNLLLFLNPV